MERDNEPVPEVPPTLTPFPNAMGTLSAPVVKGMLRLVDKVVSA